MACAIIGTDFIGCANGRCMSSGGSGQLTLGGDKEL